jgi:hypothetical protein
MQAVFPGKREREREEKRSFVHPRDPCHTREEDRKREEEDCAWGKKIPFLCLLFYVSHTFSHPQNFLIVFWVLCAGGDVVDKLRMLYGAFLCGWIGMLWTDKLLFGDASGKRGSLSLSLFISLSLFLSLFFSLSFSFSFSLFPSISSSLFFL